MVKWVSRIFLIFGDFFKGFVVRDNIGKLEMEGNVLVFCVRLFGIVN